MAVKQEKTAEDFAREIMASREADLAALDAQAAPLRAQIDELHAQKGAIDLLLAPLVEQWAPLNQRRQDLQNEIGKLARMTGGKSTSDAN